MNSPPYAIAISGPVNLPLPEVLEPRIPPVPIIDQGVSDDSSSSESETESESDSDILPNVNNKWYDDSLLEELKKYKVPSQLIKIVRVTLERNKIIEEEIIKEKMLLNMERIKKNTIIKAFKIIENHYDNEKCAICREVEGEKVVLSCKHIFHEECIKKWNNTTCPMCRRVMQGYLFKFESKISKYEHKVVE